MANRKWDTYVTEARHDPFLIEAPDGEIIRIENPSGAQVIAMQRAVTANRDVEHQLRILAGDAADSLLPLVKSAPAQAMERLLRDVMSHFGFDTGESLASSS